MGSLLYFYPCCTEYDQIGSTVYINGRLALPILKLSLFATRGWTVSTVIETFFTSKEDPSAVPRGGLLSLSGWASS